MDFEASRIGVPAGAALHVERVGLQRIEVEQRERRFQALRRALQARQLVVVDRGAAKRRSDGHRATLASGAQGARRDAPARGSPPCHHQLMLRGRLTALSTAFAALALVGCGGGNGGGQATGTQAAPGGGSTGGGTSGSGGPGGAGSSQAPTARPRPADAASLRVIRGWSDALRRGQRQPGDGLLRAAQRGRERLAAGEAQGAPRRSRVQPLAPVRGAAAARLPHRRLHRSGVRPHRATRRRLWHRRRQPGGHGVRHQARQDRRVAASRRPADRGRGTAIDSHRARRPHRR